jgi:hypothetical protein
VNAGGMPNTCKSNENGLFFGTTSIFEATHAGRTVKVLATLYFDKLKKDGKLCLEEIFFTSSGGRIFYLFDPETYEPCN